ncbi:MAG: DeoR/GlpR transcriptional regulator [Chloroflexi bacterium]|nr:DeoR/GlpR transcriptional regulator [Chloroflexota bacterium]
MLPLDRQNQILQLLHQKGFLTTHEIINRFDVSQMTVWRDIRDLEGQALVKRIHGGISLPGWELGDEHILDSTIHGEHIFEFPAGLSDPRRLVLGKYVAREIIKSGDDLILEGGSTVSCIIPFLTAEDITAITNGLYTITLAQVYKTVQTILCCGGVLNQPNAIFIGPQAENFFLSYRADIAIVSASGLTLQQGLVDPSPIYDSMKRVMCKSARKRVVMLDSMKIGKGALTQVMGLNEIDVLVTNHDADPTIIAALIERGMDIRLI